VRFFYISFKINNYTDEDYDSVGFTDGHPHLCTALIA